MISFATTLIGNAQYWYFNLPSSSISTWEGFFQVFRRRWSPKKDVVQIYKGLLSSKRREDEPLLSSTKDSI